nr:MAG TPA: hypothetical protein [Caudoviricetes sp.]
MEHLRMLQISTFAKNSVQVLSLQILIIGISLVIWVQYTLTSLSL